jgi:hypothetical protein
MQDMQAALLYFLSPAQLPQLFPNPLKLVCGDPYKAGQVKRLT